MSSLAEPATQPVDPGQPDQMRGRRDRQCDLWFPSIAMPVGFGQTRSPAQMPVLTVVTGYSRWLSGTLIPSRRGGGS